VNVLIVLDGSALDARIIDLAGLVPAGKQRRDSIELLAAYAQSLRRHGIDPAAVTKDSAIGNPAEVFRETARHFGADLVMVGGRDSRQTRQVVEDAGQAASAPYSVLVVPPVNQAVARITSAPVGCVPATPE